MFLHSSWVRFIKPRLLYRVDPNLARLSLQQLWSLNIHADVFFTSLLRTQIRPSERVRQALARYCFSMKNGSFMRTHSTDGSTSKPHHLTPGRTRMFAAGGQGQRRTIISVLTPRQGAYS